MKARNSVLSPLPDFAKKVWLFNANLLCYCIQKPTLAVAFADKLSKGYSQYSIGMATGKELTILI